MNHETITVSANVGIDVLAQCADVTIDEFRALNPQLRRWALPPSPARQLIHLPRNRTKKFLSALDKIPSDRRITHRRHTVKPGETLGTVAKQYGVSANAIQTVNKIRNVNRISVGQNLVIPVDGDSSGSRSLASSTGGTPASKRPQTHKIKSGQTLSGIAKTHGVRISDLKRWNNLKNANRIRPGQKLKLYGAAPGPKWGSYTVRRGDTLSGIARRHGCSTTQLRDWNKISGSRIMAGQKLRVQK